MSQSKRRYVRAHMFADFVTAIFSLGHVFKVPGSLRDATPVHGRWITTNFIPGASREKALSRPSYPPHDLAVQSPPR